MTKEEFLSQLRNRLKKLPPEEVNDALEYYEEYLEEAGPEHELETIRAWGNPRQVASQIMAQYAIKQMTEEPSVHKGISSVWMIVLAIFASPIALPLAAALAVIVLALLICLLAVLLSLSAAAVSIVVSGLACFVVGLFLIAQSLPTCLLFTGVGLFLSGLGVIFSIFVARISIKSFRAIINQCSKHLPGRTML